MAIEKRAIDRQALGAKTRLVCSDEGLAFERRSQQLYGVFGQM